jgi:hypothetical protein
LVLMTVEHLASELLKLRFETGTEIEVTPLHPFLVEGVGWVFARDLKPAVFLRSDFGAIRLESVSPAPSNRNVFNLEVGLEHTYRVSADRIWVHNDSPLDPSKTPVYRGGSSMKARQNVDVKMTSDGMVKSTRGISLNTDPGKLSAFGTPQQIKSIPEGLSIVPYGKPGHYELVPTAPMTFDKYQTLLDEVTFH